MADYAISTHALREEGDSGPLDVAHTVTQFLPTPSARRATGVSPDRVADYAISTHALREEGDFYRFPINNKLIISTHALREEGDAFGNVRGGGDGDFYPRPPRGGRLPPFANIGKVFRFLPTPSARRATEHFGQQRDRQPISTHALREEGDISSEWGTVAYRAFLPTPSARRATGVIYDMFSESEFLPTPSARRATANVP